MAETSQPAMEPSREFIDTILECIKARWFITISDLIDFAGGKFPKTFTRNNVKLFVIKALRVLTERGAIDTKLVSLKDKEMNFVYPTN